MFGVISFTIFLLVGQNVFKKKLVPLKELLQSTQRVPWGTEYLFFIALMGTEVKKHHITGSFSLYVLNN